MIIRFISIPYYSLSELPECQVPLAMRTDVIDQTLAVGLHPTDDYMAAITSVTVILSLAQSPETHVYIVREEIIRKMFEICEQKHERLKKQASVSRQGKKEDPMAVNALKYVAILPFLSLS